MAASVGGWGEKSFSNPVAQYNAAHYAQTVAFFSAFDLSPLPETPISIPNGTGPEWSLGRGFGASILYQIEDGGTASSLSGSSTNCFHVPNFVEFGTIGINSTGSYGLMGTYHCGTGRIWFTSPITVVRRIFTDSVVQTSDNGVGGGNPVRTNANVVIESEETLLGVLDITIPVNPSPSQGAGYGRFTRLTF